MTFIADCAAAAANRILALLNRIFAIDYWNVGIAECNPEDLVRRGMIGPVHWLPARSKSSYRADPCLWPVDGQSRILYEHYEYYRGRAHIRSAAVDELLRGADGRVEIERPHHLSYPFALCDEGVWYCIPESAAGGGVDLYVWDQPTSTWRQHLRIVDRAQVLDPTVVYHQGLWYLFGTLLDNGPNERLCIWWSHRLEGPWRSHKISPAKIDRASARPAGPLFRVGSRLYRPAQDCRRSYGGGVCINRIERLTPTEYAETVVSEVQPDAGGPFPHGLHTLVVVDTRVIVDGKRREYRPLAALFNILWLVFRPRAKHSH